MKNRVPTRGASHTPKRAFRPSSTMLTLGFGIVAVLALSGFAAACGSGGGNGNHGKGNGLTTNCSAKGPVDALQIPLAPPTTAAASGSTLDAAYELQIQNYTGADSGTVIHVPSFYVKIPTNSTAKFPLYIAPTNVTLSSSGWSAPVTANGTLSAAASFTGLHGAKATGSTVSIALMQKGPTAGVQIAFRWGWTLNASGTVSSAWSVPSSTAVKPNLPSILTPAPYVSLDATTNTTAAVAGTNFEALLDGAVGNTTFGVSVEYPNGTEVVCKEQKNPYPTTCDVVSVPLTYNNSTQLAPGNYIVHIHDSIGAIVHTISITVVAPSWHQGWGWNNQQQQLSCPCQSGHGGNGGNGGNWGGQSNGSGNGRGPCGQQSNSQNGRDERGYR